MECLAISLLHNVRVALNFRHRKAELHNKHKDNRRKDKQDTEWSPFPLHSALFFSQCVPDPTKTKVT